MHQAKAKRDDDGRDAGRIDRLLASVENERNRALLRRYVAERQVNGVKPRTLGSQLVPLRDLMNALGKRDASASGREDVASFLNQKRTRRSYRFGNHGGAGVPVERDVGLAATTRAERAKLVRAFYRWLGKPEAVDWIKPNRTRTPRAQAADLLTTKEMEKLLDAARTTRDRALLAFLAESGLRESELCALRVGDVIAQEDGAIRATLPDADNLKTGRRSVLLFDCAGLVHAWLKEHPGRTSGAAEEGSKARARWLLAPLFCGWDSESPLRPRSVYDIVVRTGRRAKLAKRVFPHLLRFGAATHDAKRGMPPAAMSKKYGWSDTSIHPLYYSRLAQQDVEEWERQKRGLAATEAPDGSVIQPVECPRCKLANRPGTAFCGRCARPLTIEAESELESRKMDDIKTFIAEEVRRAMQSA
ncbi:MAG: tyrosine-type recombinase/integrase [Thermoplasmatota archaeon]